MLFYWISDIYFFSVEIYYIRLGYKYRGRGILFLWGNWKKNKGKLENLQEEIDLKFNPDVKYTDADGKVYEGPLCKEIQRLTEPLFDKMEVKEKETPHGIS